MIIYVFIYSLSHMSVDILGICRNRVRFATSENRGEGSGSGAKTQRAAQAAGGRERDPTLWAELSYFTCVHTSSPRTAENVRYVRWQKSECKRKGYFSNLDFRISNVFLKLNII